MSDFFNVQVNPDVQEVTVIKAKDVALSASNDITQWFPANGESDQHNIWCFYFIPPSTSIRDPATAAADHLGTNSSRPVRLSIPLSNPMAMDSSKPAPAPNTGSNTVINIPDGDGEKKNTKEKDVVDSASTSSSDNTPVANISYKHLKEAISSQAPPWLVPAAKNPSPTEEQPNSSPSSSSSSRKMVPRVLLMFPNDQPLEMVFSVLTTMQYHGAACPIDPKLSPEAIATAAAQLHTTVAIGTLATCPLLQKAGCFDEIFTVDVSLMPCQAAAAAAGEGAGGGNKHHQLVLEITSAPLLHNHNATQGISSSTPSLVVPNHHHSHPYSHSTPEGGGLILRTSGTTNAPKLVPIPTHTLHYNAMCIAKSLQLTAADVSLNVMPLFHIGGLSCTLFAVLASGSSCVLALPFDVQRAIDVIVATNAPYQPTWYYAAPTIHSAVLLYLRSSRRVIRESDHRLRLIRSGAAALRHCDACELRDQFPISSAMPHSTDTSGATSSSSALPQQHRISVLPTYSMSECMPVCSPPANWDLRVPDVVGYPIGPDQLRVVDSETGEPLPYDQTGEIVIRGPGVIKAYEFVNADSQQSDKSFRYPKNEEKNSESETVAADGEGYKHSSLPWFHTGDLGRISAATGMVSLHGRAKEVVKYGGEQVSLFEVDEAILQSPCIVDLMGMKRDDKNNISGGGTGLCAVSFPVLNDFWGEEVQAFVVVPLALRQEASGGGLLFDEQNFATSILAHCKSVLEPHKVPRKIILLESMNMVPTTATGKVKRREVATALQTVAVDVSARNAITEGSAIDVKPSKSLLGLRVILAFWVVLHHIAYLPSPELNKVRNFSLDMPAFIFLGGFQLASATQRAITSRSDRCQFYINRIGASHGLVMVAVLISLPVMFYHWTLRAASVGAVSPTVADTQEEVTIRALVDFVLILPASVYAAMTGVWTVGFWFITSLFWGGPVTWNGPLWFQGVFNLLILLFPFVDGIVRQYLHEDWHFAVAILVAGILSIISILFVWLNILFLYTIVTHFFVFVLGVVVWHLMLRHAVANPPFKHRLKWAVITDVTTLLWIAILLLIAFVTPSNPNEEWDYYSNATSELVLQNSTNVYERRVQFPNTTWANATGRPTTRLSSPVGDLLGFYRVSFPLMVLWLYGLAQGEGVTAYLLSAKCLAEWLSPLAFPLYVFHVPIATYVWMIHGALNRNDPMEQPVTEIIWGSATVPFPIPWWLAFCVVVPVCLILGWLYNEYMNPYLMPLMLRWFRWQYRTCCGCCGACCGSNSGEGTTGEQGDARENDGDLMLANASVLTRVQFLIRGLTGTDTQESTCLENIGVDSFGLTALCGVLRAEFGETTAATLRPLDVGRCVTVGNLAKYIEDGMGVK